MANARPSVSPITGNGGLRSHSRSGMRSSRSRTLASAGRAGMSKSMSAGHIYTLPARRTKGGDWVCPCCNPGYDGGMSKPSYISSGDRYKQVKTNEAFFSRGAGYFKSGAVRKKEYRCGAVHTREAEVERRKPSEKVFKPNGKATPLFSKPSLLGPNEKQTLRERGAGGAFKTGKLVRKQEDSWAVEEQFRVAGGKEVKMKYVSDGVKPFKAGGPAGDFFDASMYVRGEEERRVAKREEGRWYGAGRGGRDFNKWPEHVPDEYREAHVAFTWDGRFWNKVNRMERAVTGPGMYICYCDPNSRTSKLVDTASGKVLKEWRMNEAASYAPEKALRASAIKHMSARKS